ncbi:GNAT family N-acetyltransferase [Hymenobacter sp. H14-R3]|uniref:GNAT family N-acetyltransferase n=1 Tax=Hymenobacter sp. H14-R3 TaxID=3046308 RepID=UPI0024B895DB|nr:GNAT family N-acetyltransferase [Hymenobacter sp. H14-R3]MDJ0365941.1 GNAT family N-acetyltransferase [Hymenobacter sp. H14-R3]
MIRYLRPGEVDRPQWDALLGRAPNGLIYGLSWYLDIVSPGWAALVKEEAGRYVAVLPLPVRTKFGLRYLKQPLFAQQLGLFYLEAPTAADWQQIGALLRQRFRFITQYAFNTRNQELLGPGQPGLAGAAFTTYYLSLQPNYPQLLAGYKANRRWRLNQARRRGLRVEPSTDIDLLVRIFAEYTAPKIHGVIGEAYEYRLLRALYAAASQQHMAHMWQARAATGEVVAMILLFEFNGQLTYIFNSSTPAGKEAGAISVLLDEVFRTYAGRATTFDFEAPEVASVAHFYASFGSVAAPFHAIAANRLPWPVRQLKAARMALYRRLRPRPAPPAD